MVNLRFLFSMLVSVACLSLLAVASCNGGDDDDDDNNSGGNGNGGHSYTCDNGTPESGDAPQSNIEKCAYCDSGYERNINDRCVADNSGNGGGRSGYRYTCDNGTPASGDAPQSNVEKCASCDSGYRRNANDLCVADNTPRPDLVVSVTLNSNSASVGEAITGQATIRNEGDASSTATTARLYVSDDATINSSDSEEASGDVPTIVAGGFATNDLSITFTGSGTTAYLGVCVDSVSGESDTSNNCSAGQRVMIIDDGGGSVSVSCTSGDVSCSGIPTSCSQASSVCSCDSGSLVCN